MKQTSSSLFPYIKRDFGKGGSINQQYLAKRLSQQTSLPYDCSILIRRKKTKSQVGLTAKERHQNLKNAFFIEESTKENIADKSILLIDDVITTGVTVNTAASILKSEGASKVYILSLAPSK